MSDPAIAALCRFIPKYLQFLRTGVDDMHISPARFAALEALSCAEMSMADLANAISVTKRNVTTLIDGMERDGLVARLAHPTDRRVKLLALTEAGRAMNAASTEALHGRVDKLIGDLSAPDREKLSVLLDLISAELDARRN